jgi:BNR/Asp-box repeat
MLRFRLAALPLLFAALSLAAQPGQSSPRHAHYTWRNVAIVGGGFVDGVIFHPAAPDVVYARTDMGGAYRWDPAAHRWQPILDWVPLKDLNLMGVASIAIDPADPNRVYLACGTYTNPRASNGAILRSDDRGRTFQRTDVPFKFGANEDGRGNGERLVVDPRDGRVLFLGTRHDGLWRSDDRGRAWSRVTGFPDVTEPIPPMPPPIPGETFWQRWRRMPARGDGIVFIKFQPATSSSARARRPTQTLYVGASLMHRPNLFVSHDGGTTWQPIPGEPQQYRPTRAALAADGMLYVTFGTAPGPSRMTDGGVWKLDTRTGSWTDITPDRPVSGKREFGYAAVSVDAHHPRTLIVSTFGRPGGDDIFRSTDGGQSWRPIFTGDGHGAFNYSLAPYVEKTPIHWLFDIEIDPTNPNHAVFTTGYGGWQTFDLTDSDRGQPTHWSILARGIEETVALALLSPARGAHLISAIGDYGGFVHWNLNQPALAGSSSPPRFGNTTGLALAALHPLEVVRVGISARHLPGQNISYTLDGGQTWQGTPAAPSPRSMSGSVAVSADGATWIWTPEREQPSVTHDRGATWTPVEGLASNMRVVADPMQPSVFYALSLPDHTLYRSTDGGAHFTPTPLTLPGEPDRFNPRDRGDNRGGQDQLYSAPGRSGDLWIAAYDGLFHAAEPVAPSGAAPQFVRMRGVQQMQAFGFGKAAPGAHYPALYMAGTVDGQPGVFRSTDEARTWLRINDDRHKWGLILQITGDPRIYGRVYVGTHGRGVQVGDPAR